MLKYLHVDLECERRAQVQSAFKSDRRAWAQQRNEVLTNHETEPNTVLVETLLIESRVHLEKLETNIVRDTYPRITHRYSKQVSVALLVDFYHNVATLFHNGFSCTNVNFRALDTKLKRICLMRFGSDLISPLLLTFIWYLISIFFDSACMAISSITSSTIYWIWNEQGLTRNSPFCIFE
jgi:hypothetical protein